MTFDRCPHFEADLKEGTPLGRVEFLLLNRRVEGSPRALRVNLLLCDGCTAEIQTWLLARGGNLQ